MLRKIAITIMTLVGRVWGRFITVHTRPMYVADMPYTGKENPDDALCAIIMQGPIRSEDNFTLETVKLYRRHYPSATVILSTWENEDVSAFEGLEGEKFKLMRNKKPSNPGSSNINMQIVSTKAGIDRAVQMGLKYVLKTRSDQRMYGIDSLKFLKNMLDCFPVLHCELQRKRIISNNTGTNRSIPHHFSDLFMFGDAVDMQLYWTSDIVTADFYVEAYLFQQFLQKTGWEIKNTNENFMSALGERCIIVDNESVDVYWPKNSPKHVNVLREYRLRDYLNPAFGMSFKSWLNDAYMPARKSLESKHGTS